MATILHIAEKAQGGGAESVFRDTIVKLKGLNDGNQNFVACMAESGEPFKVDYDFDKLKQTKISPIFSYNNYKFLKRSLNHCNPDVIHIQNYGILSPSILKAVLEYKKNKTKTKVIQTVHTFEYVCSHYAAFDYRKNKRCTDCAKTRFKFKIFYRGCSRLGYLHSWAKGITSLIANYYIKKKVIDIWLTPSEFLKGYMLEGKLNDNQIKVLRNPMNELFLKQDYDLNNKEGRPFEFVYFGRFSEEKNIDVLIDGFCIFLKDNVNARLILIGRGSQKNDLINKSKNLNILNFVEWIDFLSTDELVKRLERAHVSILSSKCFETASLVINEAVMCGVIPVTSNHGAMKETLNILNVGLSFNSEDPRDLAAKLKECLIKYESYYKELRPSYDIIKQIYDPQKYIQFLLDVYKTPKKAN